MSRFPGGSRGIGKRGLIWRWHAASGGSGLRSVNAASLLNHIKLALLDEVLKKSCPQGGQL
jgi:hypothetical protein